MGRSGYRWRGLAGVSSEAWELAGSMGNWACLSVAGARKVMQCDDAHQGRDVASPSTIRDVEPGRAVNIRHGQASRCLLGA